MKVLGALAFLKTVEFERVVDQAQMAVIHTFGGYQEAAAVDFTLAGDSDVLLLDGEDESGPLSVRITDIVPGVEGTQKAGSFFDVQGDVRFEIDCAGHEITAIQYEPSASVVRDVVDGRLQRCRVESLSVCLGSEIGCQIVLGACADRNQGESQNRSNFEQFLHC